MSGGVDEDHRAAGLPDALPTHTQAWCTRCSSTLGPLPAAAAAVARRVWWCGTATTPCAPRGCGRTCGRAGSSSCRCAVVKCIWARPPRWGTPHSTSSRREECVFARAPAVARAQLLQPGGSHAPQQSRTPGAAVTPAMHRRAHTLTCAGGGSAARAPGGGAAGPERAQGLGGRGGPVRGARHGQHGHGGARGARHGPARG